MKDEFDAKFRDFIRAATRSPIEEKLALALLDLSSLAFEVRLPNGERRKAVSEEVSGRLNEHGLKHHTVLELRPQEKVDRYSVDLMLVMRKYDSSVRVAVECDGHDFHERTKAQAQHDRARDRHFTSIGLVFLRFTGSEIHRDAAGCAAEIDKVLTEMLNKKLEAEGRQ